MRFLRSLTLLLALLVSVPASAIISFQNMTDANLTVGANTTAVVINSAFTAARTVTLPFAGSTTVGQSGAATYYQNQITIYDAASTVTGVNTLTIQAQSGDTINGSSTLVVSTAGATVILTPVSGSKWQAVVTSSAGVGGIVSPANGGTGVSNAANLTVSSATSIGRGQYQGTNTNDAATSGNIGEKVQSTVLVGAPVALSTTVTSNLTSLSVPAGDWRLGCSVYTTLGTNTVVTFMEAGVTVTSGVMAVRGVAAGGIDGGSNNFVQLNAGTANNNVAVVTGPVRASFASTTTVYCVANATFTVSTASVYGVFTAERVR